MKPTIESLFERFKQVQTNDITKCINIKQRLIDLAIFLVSETPDCMEQQQMLKLLDALLYYAIASIVRHGDK